MGVKFSKSILILSTTLSIIYEVNRSEIQGISYNDIIFTVEVISTDLFRYNWLGVLHLMTRWSSEFVNNIRKDSLF